MPANFDDVPAWRRYMRFWGSDPDADVAEELRFHIESRVEELMASGMTEEAARRAAHERFGDVPRIADTCRELLGERDRAMRRSRWYADVRQDLRHAVRELRGTPAFTAIAVLTIALGIGANTAIFSAIQTLLLRPLPYPDADRLVTIDHFYPTREKSADGVLSAAGYRNYREGTRSLATLAVINQTSMNLTGFGEPVRVPALQVSREYFDAYGTEPVTGRRFLPSEDAPGGQFVVVISQGLSERLFGGTAAALGRKVMLHAQPYEVVGVMPHGFRDFYDPAAELWMPLALTEEQYADDPTNEWLFSVGRLKPGVNADDAALEMREIAEVLKTTSRNYGADWTIVLRTMDDHAKGTLRPALLVLLGAVALLLLIACANVANLLLVRATGRRRNLAIRAALGADRGRLARGLLVESFLIALTGGGIGVLAALAGVRVFNAVAGDATARFGLVTVDATVMLFALGASVLTVLLFGLVPALRASQVNVERTLREGGRGNISDRTGQRIQRGVVVTELALALTLLVCAGLLIRSFGALNSVDPGFTPEHVLTMQVSLPEAKYTSDTSQIAFFDEALSQLRQIPGVRAAGATAVLPFSGEWRTGAFWVEGYQRAKNEPLPWGDVRVVSPDYAAAMGIQLIRGRFFAASDRHDAPRVAVVDERLVKRFALGDAPIGKRVRFPSAPGETPAWMTVVGVVPHTKHEGLDADDRPQLYVPYTQNGMSSMSFVVRTNGDPLIIAARAQAAVKSVDRDQPITRVTSVDKLVDASLGQRRVSTTLLAGFAALAALLAGLGLYGVMSHVVAQRRRELGVRMALGATAGTIALQMLRESARLATAGVVIGIFAAMALTRLLTSQLYAVQPGDPLTYSAVTLALLVLMAIAVSLPVLRAARVDPLVTLTSD